jgi:hypothetical protein
MKTFRISNYSQQKKIIVLRPLVSGGLIWGIVVDKFVRSLFTKKTSLQKLTIGVISQNLICFFFFKLIYLIMVMLRIQSR